MGDRARGRRRPLAGPGGPDRDESHSSPSGAGAAFRAGVGSARPASQKAGACHGERFHTGSGAGDAHLHGPHAKRSRSSHDLRSRPGGDAPAAARPRPCRYAQAGVHSRAEQARSGSAPLRRLGMTLVWWRAAVWLAASLLPSPGPGRRRRTGGLVGALTGAAATAREAAARGHGEPAPAPAPAPSATVVGAPSLQPAPAAPVGSPAEEEQATSAPSSAASEAASAKEVPPSEVVTEAPPPRRADSPWGLPDGDDHIDEPAGRTPAPAARAGASPWSLDLASPPEPEPVRDWSWAAVAGQRADPLPAPAQRETGGWADAGAEAWRPADVEAATSRQEAPEAEPLAPAAVRATGPPAASGRRARRGLRIGAIVLGVLLLGIVAAILGAKVGDRGSPSRTSVLPPAPARVIVLHARAPQDPLAAPLRRLAQAVAAPPRARGATAVRAVRSLSRAYSRAGSEIAGTLVAPQVGDRRTALAASLRNVGRAYARLAGALVANRRAPVLAATRGVRTAQARVVRAAAALGIRVARAG